MTSDVTETREMRNVNPFTGRKLHSWYTISRGAVGFYRPRGKSSFGILDGLYSPAISESVVASTTGSTSLFISNWYRILYRFYFIWCKQFETSTGNCPFDVVQHS